MRIKPWRWQYSGPLFGKWRQGCIQEMSVLLNAPAFRLCHESPRKNPWQCTASHGLSRVRNSFRDSGHVYSSPKILVYAWGTVLGIPVRILSPENPCYRKKSKRACFSAANFAKRRSLDLNWLTKTLWPTIFSSITSKLTSNVLTAPKPSLPMMLWGVIGHPSIAGVTTVHFSYHLIMNTLLSIA